MKTLILIPARYGSTRFPQKPLAQIAGVPLLTRVIDVARRTCAAVEGAEFAVATDHADIVALAEKSGARAIMTDPDLPSGTDRAYAAACGLETPPDFVVNLQGDAPFTPVSYIQDLITTAQNHSADVVTPVTQLDWAALDTLRAQKQIHPFSGTTCIRLADGKGVWFSKNLLPAIRKEDALRNTQTLSPVFRHIGLYGYRMDALKRFVALPVGHYEALEGLEQLRFLENGMQIQTVTVNPTPLAMWGIDTPEDAVYAETLIVAHGDPFKK